MIIDPIEIPITLDHCVSYQRTLFIDLYIYLWVYINEEDEFQYSTLQRSYCQCTIVQRSVNCVLLCVLLLQVHTCCVNRSPLSCFITRWLPQYRVQWILILRMHSVHRFVPVPVVDLNGIVLIQLQQQRMGTFVSQVKFNRMDIHIAQFQKWIEFELLS